MSIDPSAVPTVPVGQSDPRLGRYTTSRPGCSEIRLFLDDHRFTTGCERSDEPQYCSACLRRVRSVRDNHEHGGLL